MLTKQANELILIEQIWYLNNEKFTGILYEEDEGGNRTASYTCVNGLFNGVFQEWYSNGQLKIEGHCESDFWTGVIQKWDKEGRLVYKALCDRKKMLIIKEEYYDNEGKLVSELQNRNLYHTSFNRFVLNSLPRIHEDEFDEIDPETYEYRNMYQGKPFTGVYYETHPNGNISTEYTCEVGECMGPYTEWHSNGIIAEKGHQYRNELDGIIQFWDKEGNLIKEILRNAKYGFLIHKKKWSGQGQLVYHKTNIDHNYRLSIYNEKFWYSNGQLKEEKNVDLGMLVEHQEWDENGELIRHFKMDQSDVNYDDYVKRKKDYEIWLEQEENE